MHQRWKADGLRARATRAAIAADERPNELIDGVKDLNGGFPCAARSLTAAARGGWTMSMIEQMWLGFSNQTMKLRSSAV